MKFRSQIIFAFLFICTATAFGQEKSYILKGRFIQPAPVKTIQFVQKGTNGNDISKVIPVVNNTFVIEGKLKENAAATLQFGADTNQVLFFLDEGETSIVIGEALPKAIITGSKTTTDLRNFLAGEAKFLAEFQKLSEKAELSLKEGQSQELVSQKYYEEAAGTKSKYLAYHKNFIVQHPKSYISLIIIPKLVEYTQDYIQADSLLQLLTPELRKTETAGTISTMIEKEKKTSIGAYAADFSMADTTGKQMKLSSLKGKYVLLDFWASWCGPCRQENPNVVSAYQTYKDKGFTVLGVSLDQDKKNWLKAIEKDNLNWSHVSDLKFWKNAVAVEYGITAIPRNFLLDPNGKIIAKDLRGPELQQKLQELFN